MSHREELLEQLKKIRLEWFRSAAHLDRVITEIEHGLEETDDVINQMYIRMMRAHREDSCKVNGWDEILKLENVVWQQLIETKEES